MGLRAAALTLALALCCAQASDALADDLSGTAWRLVKIMSMDDRVDAPDDPSDYTLEFRADGSAAILADCNRGMGSWVSESTSQLQFGPIASTQAMCLPGSLSETYLAQFVWVRSYVMQDGHLFLATMADGSIIEFEPVGVAPRAATVLGEEVRTTDAAVMQDVILTRLFDRYASEQGVGVEPAEVDSYVEMMERGMVEQGLTAEKDLTPEEAQEVAAMRRSMAESIIRQWKINRSLYDRYGGRIIYQQLGPEPLDAYQLFLEQRHAEGAFAIHDPALEQGFWNYFNNDALHDFMELGSADEARAFKAPPWEATR